MRVFLCATFKQRNDTLGNDWSENRRLGHQMGGKEGGKKGEGKRGERIE